MDYPPLRIVRFSGASLTTVSKNIRDGVTVRVTDVARTVADCFKFRKKIGLDVAMEVLQEAWRAKRVSMDELWRYATLCRVANVMRPLHGHSGVTTERHSMPWPTPSSIQKKAFYTAELKENLKG